MSFMRRKSRHLSERMDDSFVISDSDDEEGAAGRTRYNFDSTHRDTRVIDDSDTESEISKNRDLKGNPGESKISDSDKSETLDSEEEDLQFMNRSQRVSIIVNSSEESESESEEEKFRSNKLKRRSIYDNLLKLDTSSSISTPINIRKRPRGLIYSDSESEGLPDVHMKTPVVTKNQKHFIESIEKDENNDIHFEENSNDSKLNEMETSNGSNYQECSNNSDGFNRDKEQQKQLSDDSMSDNLKTSTIDRNTHSNVKSVFANDKSKLQNNTMDSDSELEISETSTDNSNRVGTGSHRKERSPLKEKKLNAKNVVDLTHDSIHDNSTKKINTTKRKENLVDLTLNESRNSSVNTSINKSLQKEEKSSAEEIIISSSASESEIDQEALALARKEIGVGNIDFLEAQKKEHLLLNIENAQKQLDKLNKFAASVDIKKLPDKGDRVHQTIIAQVEKLKSLKLKLATLPRKKTMNALQKVETPKTKAQPKVKTERSFISPLVDRTNSVKKEPKMERDLKFSKQFDEFDVRDIPDVPQTSFDTGDLGKKALETLNKQQSLTHDRLKQLHGSLTSRPTEDQREKGPSGLKIQLMAHQQHALAWTKWREKQKPKGGILADDMGLGKTLTMISLILATVDQSHQRSNTSDESSSDDEWLSRNKHKRHYGGTLVVCPASLIKQWEAEVKNRVKKGLLSVLVFHGNNRSMEDRKLSKYNIVITTYQILVREADAETGMYKMEWNRIILDEAHYIRNHKSKACIAVCGLNAKHRWALTGTPIQNKEMDVYAILKFLNCSPFNDLQVWKRWVDNKNDAGKQRLITIMKTMMLRRTKQELHSKGNLDSLPEKFFELIEVEMDREEDLVYKKILLFSQNLFAQFLAQRAEKQHTKELYGGKFDKPSLSSLGSKTLFTKAQKMLLDHHSNVEAHEILVLLLRLRQMCCHPALIHAMLDKQDAELNGIADEENTNADLLNKLHNMSINEDEEIEEHVANFKIDERVAANLLTKKNRVFDDDRQSSKVRAILRTVGKVVDKGDKLIIVSQWTSFLKVIANHLDDMDDAYYAMFTGEVAVKNRQAIVDKLNNPGDEINILLLSLTAGGVGLNLIGANHLLLTDIHWNPQLEAQAQDRIYRFGQKKNVFIYKFICKETIEERIKNLQDKKLDIANHVLTGTRSVSSKLTIEDLKLLFS